MEQQQQHWLIKILPSSFILYSSETYLKTCQTSQMEHFTEIVTMESKIDSERELFGKTSKCDVMMLQTANWIISCLLKA